MIAALELALDVALCALILGAGLAAVAGRDVFRAVVFFIVYGLFIAVAWVRLGAYDVALAEAAIGAGLTGVLLLGAHGQLRRLAATGAAEEHPAPLRSQMTRSQKRAALAGAGVALALGWAWFALPGPFDSAPDMDVDMDWTWTWTWRWRAPGSAIRSRRCF